MTIETTTKPIKKPMESPLFKVDEVASYVTCSISKLYIMVRNGKFPPAVRIGGSNRWLKSEVDSWLQQQVSNRSEDGAHTSTG